MNKSFKPGKRVIIVRNNDKPAPEIDAVVGQIGIVIGCGENPGEILVGLPGQAELGELICHESELDFPHCRRALALSA